MNEKLALLRKYMSHQKQRLVTIDEVAEALSEMVSLNSESATTFAKSGTELATPVLIQAPEVPPVSQNEMIQSIISIVKKSPGSTKKQVRREIRHSQEGFESAFFLATTQRGIRPLPSDEASRLGIRSKNKQDAMFILGSPGTPSLEHVRLFDMKESTRQFVRCQVSLGVVDLETATTWINKETGKNLTPEKVKDTGSNYLARLGVSKIVDGCGCLYSIEDNFFGPPVLTQEALEENILKAARLLPPSFSMKAILNKTRDIGVAEPGANIFEKVKSMSDEGVFDSSKHGVLSKYSIATGRRH